jgi:hypothetical protein
MKTIGFILETIEMTLRKERRGMLKKSQIQTAVRVAINNYFDKQLTMYRVTGIIPTPLQPLIKTTQLTSPFAVPADFSKEVTFHIANVNSNPAQFVNRSEFEERKNSVLMPPTEVDPIGTIEDNQILVRPQNTGEIMLTYISQPTEIVIATTPSADERSLDYDDTNSVDTEFYREYSPDIIKEALQFLSVPQQDSNAAQLSATTKI